MGFVEGSIDGEKVLGGVVFPKTLLPPRTMESPGTCELVDLVKQKRGWLAGALQQHGAILFRGFDIASPDDFARVVDAFGWDEFLYEGAADRTKIADRVYTASEAPPEVFLPFHHEMALIKRSPPKVFFFCMQPSPEGGQTSIVRSDIVVEKMEEKLPRDVERLVREGMRFLIHTKTTNKSSDTNSGPAVALVWQRMLKTTDKAEAEERALQTLACNSVKFNDDGTADFNYGPMNPIREFEGKRVWFNSIQGYAIKERDGYASFGDGIPIPSEVTDSYGKTLEENCVDVSWQKGDLLLLNNLMVQHARRSGKPPRVVLVSLCN